MNGQHLNEGDLIKLNIKRLGINGEGIGYDKKLAIFVAGALPDELVEVKVTQVFNNRVIADLVHIIKESKDRVKPFCPVYETCGGCQLQHLNYSKTLTEKRQMIVQAFERYLPFKLAQQRVKDTLGMDDPTHYRHKASLPVRKTKRNKIGMYASGGNKFVPIKDCPVQDNRVNHILNTIIDLMEEVGVDAYDQKYRKGYMTNLIVRVSSKDEAQVTFTCKKSPNRLPQLATLLMEKEPMVKSVFSVLEEKGSREFFNDSLTKIAGEDVIHEVLGSYEFLLEPEAFFQLNSKQADVFFQTMKKAAQLKSTDIAIDAYAGSAPISHYVANDCKKVYAIEVNSSSAESAKRSLNKNGIQNVQVIKNTFDKALKSLQNEHIDVMFFDPPRVGLGEETIALIKQFQPQRIVYGSCNPSTLAKDIASLSTHYVLQETTPIDMFPYTAQVESVTLLELK